MINSLFFFGDSFTEGHTLKDSDKIWPKLIHSCFPEYGYTNVGKGGASQLFVINQIISNLHKIKQGDIVFVLETDPVRTEIYSEKLDKVIPTTARMITNIDKYDFLPNAKKESLVNYTYEHRHQYANKFTNFYSNIISDFGIYFSGIGVTFNQIPYEEERWARYESYKDSSNGVINDYHWNEKGNYEFAQYIVKEYKIVGNLSRSSYI